MGRPATLTVAETLPKSFVLSVKTRGDKAAMREKYLGIWRTITWNDWLARAQDVTHALASIGFQPGDVASVLSNTVPAWNYADMGILCAGGVSSGIYPTDSAKQVEYLVNDSRTRVIFVEDDEQLDKVLDVRERCPTLMQIVVFDMDGLAEFSDPMVISFKDFLAQGRAFGTANPTVFAQRLDTRGAKDLAILVYTSGTTGPPKGAMHSHRSICYQMENCMSLDALTWQEGDERLSFLPMCHVAERVAGCYYSVATGCTMNFAESPETVPDNIREVQPTLFGAVPRIWEKFYSGVMISLKDATALEQWAYKHAIGVGFRMADAKLAGKKPSLGLQLAFQAAYWLVLRNVRKLIGIDRCRWLFTGAAPIAPDLIRWYLALGVGMYEVYGQTENGGLATCMPATRIKLGTVGKPVPYGEVKIAETGEILIRGDHVFMGYLNQPEKTAETVDKDGWLHSGDVGMIDNEGFVKITDRMKDIIITAGGKNVTPSEIENLLKFSPYISDAVVIGDRRKFLTCLIMIDADNVMKFAQDSNIPFTNYTSLCRAKDVQELIWQEIEKVNANFARVETIKSFRLIETELTAEDDELTPTMKLKRSFVNQKYKALIDDMYRGAA